MRGYRIYLNFDDIEMFIMILSDKKKIDDIKNEAIMKLFNRGFIVPIDKAVIKIEKAPEWLEFINGKN